MIVLVKVIVKMVHNVYKIDPIVHKHQYVYVKNVIMENDVNLVQVYLVFPWMEY